MLSLVKYIEQVKMHIQFDIFWLPSVQMGTLLQIYPIFDPGRGVLSLQYFKLYLSLKSYVLSFSTDIKAKLPWLLGCKFSPNPACEKHGRTAETCVPKA